jgi:hypothetical protein
MSLPETSLHRKAAARSVNERRPLDHPGEPLEQVVPAAGGMGAGGEAGTGSLGRELAGHAA